MVPHVIAGMTNAGALGRVNVVTYNGTPSILALVANGQVLMDVGEDFNWDAWAQTDQIMRVMLGLKPVGPERTILRIWDKTNIAQAGSPPQTDKGYNLSFITGYEKLWGLRK
jgi:ribose transport system substrate-binding protein